MSEQYRAPALTGEQIDHILAAMADSFGRQLRSPVLHWPDEQGLDYQDVTFPALDGAPLEGWFIPAPGSDKLIIANRPMGSAGPGSPPTWNRGARCGRPAATTSRSTSSPITRSCTTAGTTCWPTTCATPG
jgi:hypothetical protein